MSSKKTIKILTKVMRLKTFNNNNNNCYYSSNSYYVLGTATFFV